MSYELRNEEALAVMGFFTRAANSDPRRIGDLWRRFNAAGKEQMIRDHIGDKHYCVYCEYEGDWTKEFTVVIGCAVEADAEVPEGMKKVQIAAGSFAVWKPEGVLPQSVFDVWTEVWKTPLDRLYEADYDVYGDPDSRNGASVHVGVR